MYICIFTHVSIYTYLHVCTYAHIYVHIYIYTYMYIHMYMRYGASQCVAGQLLFWLHRRMADAKYAPPYLSTYSLSQSALFGTLTCTSGLPSLHWAVGKHKEEGEIEGVEARYGAYLTPPVSCLYHPASHCNTLPLPPCTTKPRSWQGPVRDKVTCDTCSQLHFHRVMTNAYRYVNICTHT